MDEVFPKSDNNSLTYMMPQVGKSVSFVFLHDGWNPYLRSNCTRLHRRRSYSLSDWCPHRATEITWPVTDSWVLFYLFIISREVPLMVDGRWTDANDHRPQAREGNSFEQKWICHQERFPVERFDNVDGQGAREHCWGWMVFSPTNREPCLPPWQN